MNMLEIIHFCKTYRGGKRAVDDLTLTVASGDICGFIGPNGAGKTTTIRALAGVLDFEQGDIRIGGQSIREQPLACKRMLAYVPDNPELYEHMTGMRFLQFIANVYGLAEGERRARIERYAALLEITDALGIAISSYSHGMKQKLALIAALIHEPKLFVLDEPFVGLDPKATHALKELMHELCAKGCAIFFSTHVLEVAEKLCNKIAIIRQGRLAAMGNTEQIIGDGSLEDLFMELMDDA